MLTYKITYDGEPIAAKNGLLKVEQETGIMITAESDRVSINSHNPSIIARLLKAPYFEVTEVELSGNKRKRVVGVSGTIPIGSLSIKKPRKKNTLRDVVSRGNQFRG